MPAPDAAGLEEPLAEGPVVEDPSLRRRFAARYAGPHAAEDALRWLAHPSEPGPSGAASPLAALQPLRAALYRAGAGTVEVEAYRRAEEVVRTDRRAAWAALQEVLTPAAASAEPRPVVVPPASERPQAAASDAAGAGRRPRIVLAAVLGLALVAGGGFAMLRSGPQARPAATAHPTRATATVVTVQAHRADLQALSATRQADLLTAAFRAMPSPAAEDARNTLLEAPDASLDDPAAVNVLDDGGDSEDGAVTSADGAYVRAHPQQFGGGGTLQLHVVTKRPASWTWRVSVLNRSTRVVRTAYVVIGPESHGRLQSTALRLGRNEVPAGMRLTVTPAAPYFWSARYLY